MYDFHKKRNTNTNEHVFQHKNFIRGQKYKFYNFRNLRLIKRKNTNGTTSPPNTNLPDEESLLESYQKDLNSKKISKGTQEKLINLLIKNLNETNDKHKNLEKKVESLSKQNENFIMQYQQIFQEVLNKK
jgi:hypothetical protein